MSISILGHHHFAGIYFVYFIPNAATSAECVESWAKPLAVGPECLDGEPKCVEGRPESLADTPKSLASEAKCVEGRVESLEEAPESLEATPKPLAGRPECLEGNISSSGTRLSAISPSPFAIGRTAPPAFLLFVYFGVVRG